jgi:hypothetical protein
MSSVTQGTRQEGRGGERKREQERQAETRRGRLLWEGGLLLKGERTISTAQVSMRAEKGNKSGAVREPGTYSEEGEGGGGWELTDGKGGIRGDAG